MSNILGYEARVGPNIFHSMVGNGSCCPSDSRYQELFVVPRVCGCISYSRHMALQRIPVFVVLVPENDPRRVLDPLWQPWGLGVGFP